MPPRGAAVIAIFDNGGSYSDHTIYFVDLPAGWTADDVLEIAKYQSLSIRWYLCGTAEDIKWRIGGCCELRDFLNESYEAAVRQHPRYQALCALLGKEPMTTA